jgi:putative hydrolases of HD superfamily
MKNGKFTSTIIRMQFVPRWSEYAPRYEDSASSHSFRCAAVAVLIGVIESKMFNRQIDKSQLLARALWGDLNNTGTGSIKHSTKKDALVGEHIKAVEADISKTIVGYLSRSLQAVAHDYIVNAQDDSYTGRLVDAIDTFDAFLFCYREWKSEANSFFHGKMVELRTHMEQLNIASISWLLQEFDKKEGIYDFLMYFLNLDTIKRWNGSYNLIPDNDAIHSFRVASIALLNGLLEKEKYGKSQIDLYKLVGKALLHDLPEVLCGDVVTNFKSLNPQIKTAFEIYEKNTAQIIVNKLPAIFHEELTELMVEAKSDDYEGEMVDIADKLDALIKANMEMRNNPHYAETYYQQLIKIQHSYENPCVIFFLAYILHDLTYLNLIR